MHALRPTFCRRGPWPRDPTVVLRPPAQVSFAKGSATDLIDIVKSHPVTENFSGPTVVTCVNNTLGVFPDAIKPRTYSQVRWSARPAFNGVWESSIGAP